MTGPTSISASDSKKVSNLQGICFSVVCTFEAKGKYKGGSVAHVGIFLAVACLMFPTARGQESRNLVPRDPCLALSLNPQVRARSRPSAARKEGRFCKRWIDLEIRLHPVRRFSCCCCCTSSLMQPQRNRSGGPEGSKQITRGASNADAGSNYKHYCCCVIIFTSLSHRA